MNIQEIIKQLVEPYKKSTNLTKSEIVDRVIDVLEEIYNFEEFVDFDRVHIEEQIAKIVI